MTRRYYSSRTGKNPLASQIELPIVLRLFKDLYIGFTAREYFQEAFGYYCVDAGYIPGILGTEIEAQVFRRLRKDNLLPIDQKCIDYSEDDLFDVIEFLYDQVSKPEKGSFHSFSNCGWHYETFDREAGRHEYLVEINGLLQDYKNGYELSVDGEILAMAEKGLETLLQAKPPIYNPNNIEDRVDAAVLKFRRYRSSIDDRRDAIRDLADVLEYLRPKLKLVVTKSDEGDLFNIANNFGIRHHNEAQKTDYDKAIWYSWMFYYYLATIHAVLRLIEKQGPDSAST